MNIKEIRKRTGLSQRGFAEKYDISVRTLQQWEQGKSSPPEYVAGMLKRLIAYEEKLKDTFELDAYRLPEKKTFKVCISNPFQNCEKIYPIQQRKVRELLDDICENAMPAKVIIFGSSVTPRCHIGSDVDIYAEMKNDRNPIRRVHDFEYDFWSNFTVDARLMHEIKEKGVVVYG